MRRHVIYKNPACSLINFGFLLDLFFNPEMGDPPPKRQLTLSGAGCVMYPRIELFIEEISLTKSITIDFPRKILCHGNPY